jgi:adenosine deaminase
VEARFAPHHHINERLGYADIFQAVNKGFLRAKKEINIKYPDRPAFTYGLIACIMRFFRPEYGSYYKALASVLPKTSLVGLGVAAANDLVAALVEIKNKQGIPIVAVDLAGSEDGNPARPFQEVFSLARQNGIELTVHAGEAYGAESIFDAVMRLNAARIGHGYELFNKEMILDKVSDKKKYINILAQDMSQRTITCEMCLTSNSQTNPAMRDLKNHPIMQFVHAGIPVMLNTDNRLVSNTTLTNEYQIFSELFKPSIRLLRRMIMTGFHASFYPGTSNDKHKYVKQVVYALDEKLAQFAPGK